MRYRVVRSPYSDATHTLHTLLFLISYRRRLFLQVFYVYSKSTLAFYRKCVRPAYVRTVATVSVSVSVMIVPVMIPRTMYRATYYTLHTTITLFPFLRAPRISEPQHHL